MQQPPFFYVVSFHLLALEKNNELIHQNWRKEFHNSDPLIARQEAFKEFAEYLHFLGINGKIEKDLSGNFKIISPSGIPESPEIDLKEGVKNLKALSMAVSEYMSFSEDIDLLLVIIDDELVKEIGYGDSTLPIHSVSSHPIDKQNLIDNLAIEMQLYNIAGIDTSNDTAIVKHYGDDYYESGEDDESVDYSILPTPFIWTTKEQYEKEEDKENERKVDNARESFWEKIILDGETNTLEFKPSLAYNFRIDLPNYIPLYNNAKTICGFINSRGGILLIGITDSGVPQGLEKDIELLGSKDKLRLKIDELLASYFKNTVSSLIDVSFVQVENKELLAISVKPSNTPIFLNRYHPRTSESSKHFYVRRTASTTEIKDVEEIITYIFNHNY